MLRRIHWLRVGGLAYGLWLDEKSWVSAAVRGNILLIGLHDPEYLQPQNL